MATAALVVMNENEGDMNHKLTNEEIRMLAQAERQMDAGEITFVVCDGRRMIVQPVVMEELGLETGQTVSSTLVLAILEANLAALQADVALADAK